MNYQEVKNQKDKVALNVDELNRQQQMVAKNSREATAVVTPTQDKSLKLDSLQ